MDKLLSTERVTLTVSRNAFPRVVGDLSDQVDAKARLTHGLCARMDWVRAGDLFWLLPRYQFGMR